MERIKFDYSKALPFVSEREVAYFENFVRSAMTCSITKPEREMTL